MREMKDSGIEWIGEIPVNWAKTRIGNLFRFSSGDSLTNEEIQDEGLYKVYGANGPRGYYHHTNLAGKHILIGRVGALCGNIHVVDEPVWVTEHALIAEQISPDVCTDFAGRVFESMNLGQYSKASAQPVIASSVVQRLQIPIPPSLEQRRIADYLDRKCSQIDTIIARQQEVIEKLKAYKLSVITEAVTKGLNPNVPMKDSGVEWIGEIPEHWQVPKIKYLATIASGGTPDRSHPEYWNGSINWAKTGELQNNELYETEEKITELALENSSARVFSVDTILVAMYGQGKTRGMTALLKVPSATNQACAGITVYSKDITVSYLWLFLMGAYDAIREKANGSGQPNLSGALIADFNVTLPPIEEQMNICKTVAMRLPHIDSIIKQKEIIVDKLTAYKKSLIYEVVTGKKEV